MMSTLPTGDDIAVMFLPVATIKSCISCMLQRRRLHRGVNTTIP